MTPTRIETQPWWWNDADIGGAVITGRATMEYANGGRIYGLAIQRRDGSRAVVYYDRKQGTFSTVPLPANP